MMSFRDMTHPTDTVAGSFTTVAAPRSSKVHLSNRTNTFGQYVPACGGIAPHKTYSTGRPATCPRCIAVAESSQTGGQA